MEQLYLYKKIIVFACGILLLGSVFFVLLYNQIVFQLLILLPTLIILYLVYIIDKKATIIENPTRIFEKTVEDEVHEVQQQENYENQFVFEQAIESIPKSKDISILIPYTMQVIAKELEMVLGIYYQKVPSELSFVPLHVYAFPEGYEIPKFTFGEGFVGQTALDKSIIELTDIPQDYPEVVSGLGQAPPQYIIFVPLCHNNDCIGVLELGFFYNLQPIQVQKLQKFVQQVITYIHG